MNTTLKLNQKQLLAMYEKSSEFVKKNLRMQFGESFFGTGEVKLEIPVIRNAKPKSKNQGKRMIVWETIFDFTPIFRLAMYACLAWIIF